MRPIQAHSNQLYGLVDAATRQALTNANDLRSSSGRSFRLLLLLIVLLGGATALAALRLARSIRRPLRQLAAQARAITAGDLDVDELPPHGPREVAVVTETFNEMVAALRRLEVEAAESRRQLLHEATHDHLTGLANRAAALEALGQALERARDRPGPLAVLFVDLDGFKAINDTHGHAAGDVVLSVIAQRLRDAAREGDVIARLGGDEFLLIVEGLADRAIAERIADRITTIAAHPVEMDGLLLHVGASVGVAFSQGADDTVSRLVARADAAVYRAKEQGRGTTFVLDDAA
jgi:diguanylate cyclase (GGDEF)-like protein